MLDELNRASLNSQVALEPYYFKYLMTKEACGTFERFLVSPILDNRRFALIGLVRYTLSSDYAADALLLHVQGQFGGSNYESATTGADILFLLAARGSPEARRILSLLVFDPEWVEDYLNGFSLFRAQNPSSNGLVAEFEVFVNDAASTWDLVGVPFGPGPKF